MEGMEKLNKIVDFGKWGGWKIGIIEEIEKSLQEKTCGRYWFGIVINNISVKNIKNKELASKNLLLNCLIFITYFYYSHQVLNKFKKY